MKLEINYLNDEVREKTAEDEICGATWYSRWKKYESDWMDEDMKNSTVSKKVDRIVISDAQLATKGAIDDMIEFLTKARESFQN
jgi:hypothetical protein